MNSLCVVNDTIPASIHAHCLLFASHYSRASAKKLESRLLFRQPHWFRSAPEGLTAVTVAYCRCFHNYSRLIASLKMMILPLQSRRKHLQQPWMTQTRCRWCHIHHNAELAAVEVVISSSRGRCLFFWRLLHIFISFLAQPPDSSLPVWLLSVNSASW